MKIVAQLMRVREKKFYVFLGITILGLTYPLWGVLKGGGGGYGTLNEKSTPCCFLNLGAPLISSRKYFPKQTPKKLPRNVLLI
jgi:hypothetical protein